MSHLDEGTLHALLDGELENHEVAEIQAHLGSCSSCGLRLREVKEFYSEADRLIASVDVEATAPMAAARLTPAPPGLQPEPRLTPTPPGPQPEPAARREPTPRPQPAAAPSKWEPWNEPPPVLLVPDNESAAERRMQRMRRLGWAAILVVIVGAGAVEAKKFIPVGGEDVAPASNTKTVVSQEEAPARDAGALAPAPLAKADSSPTASSRTLATAPATPRETKPAAVAPTKTLAANTAARSGGNGDRKDSATSEETPSDQLTDSVTDQSAIDQSATDQPATDQPATDQAADSEAGGQAEKTETGTPSAADLASVRQRAAEALAELDRERRVKQAAAATAALDAKRKTATARTAAPASPRAAAPTPQPALAPTPPTLEQRAQIYLRIGLDEASRQLGGPAHVIEGLSPLFMGLVQGTSVAGADATRPVVRVVYQDSQGRLILLDQQRLRAGQALPPPGPLSWTIGGTLMWLNGEAGPEILRTYRPRVR
jgi:anti-sigma factor RsiW